MKDNSRPLQPPHIPVHHTYGMKNNTNANQTHSMNWTLTWVLIALFSAASITYLSGCLAAAAGGVGYAVGHESGEDHVKDGDHADDD